MRLLVVSQDFPPRVGGIETYSLELAKSFARSDEVTVVAPWNARARNLDERLPFLVERVRVPPNLLPLAMRGVVRRLLARERFDAAFHAQWQTARFTLEARRAGRVGSVFVAVHGRELLLRPEPALPGLTHYYRARRSRTLQEADAVIAVSGYVSKLAQDEGARPDRVYVCPNGVDAERFANGNGVDPRQAFHIGEGPLLLTVCRLVGRKGVDLVLLALPKILSRFPDLRYIIVGDGPKRTELERIARELGVSHAVRWAGRLPYSVVPHYVRACDVFVMTPRNIPPDVEGFGLVFLEAAAAGKPVVGSRAGGIEDAVVHGETGLLTDEGSIEQIEASIISLLENRQLALRLGERGRERVMAEMTWDHAAARVSQVMSRFVAH